MPPNHYQETPCRWAQGGRGHRPGAAQRTPLREASGSAPSSGSVRPWLPVSCCSLPAGRPLARWSTGLCHFSLTSGVAQHGHGGSAVARAGPGIRQPLLASSGSLCLGVVMWSCAHGCVELVRGLMNHWLTSVGLFTIFLSLFLAVMSTDSHTCQASAQP